MVSQGYFICLGTPEVNLCFSKSIIYIVLFLLFKIFYCNDSAFFPSLVIKDINPFSEIFAANAFCQSAVRLLKIVMTF